MSAVSAGGAFDALASGTDIQRRIGVKTSRDEPLARFTTMRVGGPADLFAVAHNLFELRASCASRGRARSRCTLLGRGSDLVIADAGIRGPGRSRSGPRARGSTASASSPTPGCRWPARRPRRQKAGLAGLEFGLAIPGTVGGAVWANAGAHERDDRGACSSRRRSCSPTAPRRSSRAAELGLGYRDSRFKRPARPGSREVVLGGDVPLEPATSRPRSRSASTRSGAGARRTSRSGIPRAGSVFRNPPGDSAGRLIDAGRAQGPPDRRRLGLREAR